MKKLALALLLLALLVGISYVNSTRSQAKLKKQYSQGYESGSQESRIALQRADSLEAAVNQTTSSYQDSLNILRSESATASDSLGLVIAQKDMEITRLKERAKAAKTQKSAAKSTAPSTSTQHAQVLDYYKRRLAGLPKDLSEYERKVALAEVRDETVKKFAITIAELDKISKTTVSKD